MVVIRVERRFPVPLAAAFAWLTDYRDDDPKLTGAVQRGRRVLSRSPDKVVYEFELALLGTTSRGTTEVRLFPPDRYEARVVSGHRTGSVYRYALAADGAGCRLSVTYDIVDDRAAIRAVLPLVKPLVARELRKMWDGYAASMERELAATAAPAR